MKDGAIRRDDELPSMLLGVDDRERNAGLGVGIDIPRDGGDLALLSGSEVLVLMLALLRRIVVFICGGRPEQLTTVGRHASLLMIWRRERFPRSIGLFANSFGHRKGSEADGIDFGASIASGGRQLGKEMSEKRFAGTLWIMLGYRPVALRRLNSHLLEHTFERHVADENGPCCSFGGSLGVGKLARLLRVLRRLHSRSRKAWPEGLVDDFLVIGTLLIEYGLWLGIDMLLTLPRPLSWLGRRIDCLCAVVVDVIRRYCSRGLASSLSGLFGGSTSSPFLLRFGLRRFIDTRQLVFRFAHELSGGRSLPLLCLFS